MRLSEGWDDIARGAIAGREVGDVYVTTSWDDGHVLDHKLAGLLEDYGIRGTFYVAPKNIEIAPRDRLRERDLRALASHHEVGSHTLTHVRLTHLPDTIAQREIRDGKTALEQAIGDEVSSFCYPGGLYSSRHTTMVRDAGFTSARTVRRGVTSRSSRYECHTTVNAYRHLVDAAYVTRLAGGVSAKAARLYWNWEQLGKALFDRVTTTGGIYHLWGHSWEIERNNDWERLEHLLAHIGRRPGVHYVDNGELAAKVL